MTDTQFQILSSLMLADETADNKVSAVSIYELMEMNDFGVKRQAVYKAMKELLQAGLVAEGITSGKKHTYSITADGKRYLDSV